MLWGGDRNIIEEDRRAELTTECEGEVGTLGPIHLNSPSLAPALDVGKVVLEGLGRGVRVRITSKDTFVIYAHINSRFYAMRLMIKKKWMGINLVGLNLRILLPDNQIFPRFIC